MGKSSVLTGKQLRVRLQILSAGVKRSVAPVFLMGGLLCCSQALGHTAQPGDTWLNHANLAPHSSIPVSTKHDCPSCPLHFLRIVPHGHLQEDCVIRSGSSDHATCAADADEQMHGWGPKKQQCKVHKVLC